MFVVVTMRKFKCRGSMVVGLEINVSMCMFWVVGELRRNEFWCL